jgi:hypothetical protein
MPQPAATATTSAPPPSLDAWLSNGPFTDPRDEAPRLAALARRAGKDPRALAEAVRSVMVHSFWRDAYQLPEDPARTFAETNLRDVRAKLRRIAELEAASGGHPGEVAPLPPAQKLIGNCRDHSVLFAALLRHQGIPARARCGFGRYFEQGKWIDHWVVERWDGRRWVISDAQLDGTMKDALRFTFDPMDLPDGEFASGGEAWLACRERGDDPLRYGILQFWGWDFIRSNLVKDVSALAGRELLPWDAWGKMLVPNEDAGAAGLAELDELARATPMRAPLSADAARALAARPGIALPRRITTFARGTPEELDLGPILDG